MYSFLAFLLLVAVIATLYYLAIKPCQTEYDYTTEDGEVKKVSLHFTKEDLYEVYEELANMPLDEGV